MQESNCSIITLQEEMTKESKELALLKANFAEIKSTTEEQLSGIERRVESVEEKTSTDFLNQQARKLISKATEETMHIYKKTVDGDFK